MHLCRPYAVSGLSAGRICCVTNKKVHPLSLLGTQVIGFTAIALDRARGGPRAAVSGREKDGLAPQQRTDSGIHRRALVRHGIDGADFLVGNSTGGLVWRSERMMPHPEAGEEIDGYWGMAGIAGRRRISGGGPLCGQRGRGILSELLGVLSKKVWTSRRETRFGEFRTWSRRHAFVSGDFGLAAGLSIGMWLLIALAYLATTRAFVAKPCTGKRMTPAKCVLLMVVSGVSSLAQLPVASDGFWQIGVVAAAIAKFFNAAPEAATACAASCCWW